MRDTAVRPRKEKEFNFFFFSLSCFSEKGVTFDTAHKGMYTELAILYSKYREEKLLEFLRQYCTK